MKKIFTILSIAFAIILINSCGTAEKVSSGDRELEKEAKAYYKEKAKDGFSAVGTGDQYSIFYNYLKDKKNVGPAIEFDAADDGDERIVKSKVEADILVKYATFIKPSNIKSRAVSEIGEINGETFDSFYSAYKYKVNSIVTASSLRFLKLSKKLPNGEYRYEVYAFEDPSAHSKRMNALYEAAEESGIAQEYAERIAEWIDAE